MFKTPHLTIYEANPVFDYEMQRVKRLAIPNRLFWYSALAQLLPSLILALLYVQQLMEAVYEHNNGSANTSANYGYYYYSYFYVSDLWDFIGATAAIMLLIAGLMSIAGSLYYVAVSVHTINQHINSGHWDLLRLTPLPDEDIYDAKSVVAEIRAWRVMNIEAGLRLALLVFLFLLVTLPPQAIIMGFSDGFWNYEFFWTSLLQAMADRPLQTILLIVMGIVAALVWLLEPRWRMRALIALGLGISARIRNISMSSLTAFFSLIGFAIGFVVALFIIGFVFAQFNLWLWRRFYDPVSGIYDYVSYGNVQFLLMTMGFFSFILTGYLYYAMIRALSQRLVQRYAFHSD